MIRGTSTDELVRKYVALIGDDEDKARCLESSIPQAIDVLYTARDAGLTMHEAGAAVANVVIEHVLAEVEA